MSLITSCPACGTMFRVVPDQLKISEGWVRCGHCGEVFDAAAHLSDASILEMPADAQAATRPTEAPTQPTELETRPAELPARAPELPARAEEAPARAAAGAPAERSADASSFFGDSQSLEPSPLDSPFVFRPSDLVREDRGSSFLPPEPDEEEGRDGEDDEASAPGLENVTFVQQARRRAFWRRPSVRIGLALLSVVLAALLVLQVAYHDRDRLALAQPSMRPALEAMCAALDCTLGAPRQIESVVIESSGFNRLRNDTYRLAFTLRNTAAVPVAAPALELTVTDAQDQPIARRVILPAEIGTATDVIPAGGDWSRALGLVLTMSGAPRVAGYRLLAFYP